MFPFKKKKSQLVFSVVFLIVGILIMIAPTTWKIGSYNINSFIVGILLAFIGAFYLMDSQ